ncbi:MAG: hypothetical protein WC795_00925 [Candidatus Paceibacterota bacterium]|jgi:hypothetical protein
MEKSIIEGIKQQGEQEIYAEFDKVEKNLEIIPKIENLTKEIRQKEQRLHRVKNTDEENKIYREIEPLNEEKSKLEYALVNKSEFWMYSPNFYEKIKPEEALNFKTYISKELDLLKSGISLAKDKVNKNPDFTDFLSLRKQYDDLVYHTENELEYDSPEFIANMEKAKELEKQGEALFKSKPPEVQVKFKELQSDWFKKEKIYDDFEYIAEKKIKILDEVIIPTQEQQEKYASLKKMYQTGFYETMRGKLYERLEKDPNNNEIEKQIQDVEIKIEKKDEILYKERERSESMLEKIPMRAKEIMDQIVL